MDAGARICQNCKENFSIEPEDLSFYEKMQVPPPTFCPTCRAIRRYINRNERGLYRRKSDYSGKEIFSSFPPETSCRVYENEVWFSDKWDAKSYGRDYDFSKNFFDQFYELTKEVPIPARSVHMLEDSDYCTNSTGLKNCYLTFNATDDENCIYCNGLDYCKDCVDCTNSQKSQFCYECFALHNCSRALYSENSNDCTDIILSKNLRGCSYCFGCMNLRNKSYHIFNQPFSKEEYFSKLAQYDLSSPTSLDKIKIRVQEFWHKHPTKFIEGNRNENVTGNFIYNSKNVRDSFFIIGGENLRYCQNLLTPTNTDCMDFTIWGENNSLVYESSQCGQGASNIKFSLMCWNNVSELEYCFNCQISSHLFGCAGMRNAKYCIFNKQYTPEEYKDLTQKIREQMNELPYLDTRGIKYGYGEYFPPQISLVAYNESAAHEFFPLTKEKALARGYPWRDQDVKNFKITVQQNELGNKKPGQVLNEIIECGHKGQCEHNCSSAFRLTPSEVQFYENMNLPIPRFCPNCRFLERLAKRGQIGTWQRACSCSGVSSSDNSYKNQSAHSHGDKPCPYSFQTSYSPDRPEIVYCESCYNAEVA